MFSLFLAHLFLTLFNLSHPLRVTPLHVFQFRLRPLQLLFLALVRRPSFDEFLCGEEQCVSVLGAINKQQATAEPKQRPIKKKRRS